MLESWDYLSYLNSLIFHRGELSCYLMSASEPKHPNTKENVKGKREEESEGFLVLLPIGIQYSSSSFFRLLQDLRRTLITHQSLFTSLAKWNQHKFKIAINY